MAINLTFKHNFHLLESTLLAMDKELRGKAKDIALTRTAAAARRDVMADLPKVFDRPTPFTMNAIRYQAAHDGQASVFISDDAAKGLSPRRYLGPEITGGQRNLKRSERALQSGFGLSSVQAWVPGKGATLDRFGNISGPTMVSLLSKLSAFGEQGYRANVSEAARKRFERLRRAVRSTRTDVFLARGRDGQPLGIWRLASRGKVVPMLVFTGRLPTYTPRFAFHDLVERSAGAHWPGEMMRAFHEAMERKR